MSGDDRKYTAADLYLDGRPHASDVDQDRVFNCYFLAPTGSLGEQQPDRIRDAIRFNPETGDFAVRLYRPPNTDERSQGQTGPIEESVTVSQDDLRRNIEREKGGSTADNHRDHSGVIWRAVLHSTADANVPVYLRLYTDDAETIPRFLDDHHIPSKPAVAVCASAARSTVRCGCSSPKT